ncbi:Clp protease ClpP [Listeria sp. SHR_NRA_18]|uniref:head maturation protease, ClpP-related n=1 Tax=Listeria sp. SHR_NRA_18 TaxID=2269046 RepID=UPI000F5F4040|nr:head maturation protease, ClpP-related [Listeria sp. SHR_NRA_18]RQW65797.1 Clp protease ClpP [Listeria sp. SHR_NRA_18]
MKLMKMPKIEKRFEFKNSVEGEDTAELYLYGSIGTGWFDEIDSNSVRQAINESNANEIHVHINSGGGDVFESIAIHNLLKAHSAKITVHVDALAGSGASVIAMAADEIIMPRNAMMMIHKAWTVVAGNADELRKVANDMDNIDHAVTESYTGRFKGEREELVNLLAKEDWITAEDCMTHGFCDKIADAVTPPPAEDNVTAASLREKYNFDTTEVAASQKNIFMNIANIKR